MILSTPADLAHGKWYYNANSKRVFKVIKNNTTHNHSKDKCSGYIIAKPPDETPIKIKGEYIYNQIQAENITKVKQRKDINTPNKTETPAD